MPASFLAVLLSTGFTLVLPCPAMADSVPSIFREALAIGRMTERILIVLLSFSSLYFGYKLFSQVEKSTSHAEFKTASFLFKMHKVGPGVFFALFGTIIAIYSLNSKLNFSDVFNATSHETTLSTVYSLSPVGTKLPDDDKNNNAEKELAENIIVIESLIQKMKDFDLTNAEKNTLTQATQKIEPIKQKLIDSIFGKNSYNIYDHCQQLKKFDPMNYNEKLPQSTKDLCLSIDSFITKAKIPR